MALSTILPPLWLINLHPEAAAAWADHTASLEAEKPLIAARAAASRDLLALKINGNTEFHPDVTDEQKEAAEIAYRSAEQALKARQAVTHASLATISKLVESGAFSTPQFSALRAEKALAWHAEAVDLWEKLQNVLDRRDEATPRAGVRDWRRLPAVSIDHDGGVGRTAGQMKARLEGYDLAGVRKIADGEGAEAN